MLTHEADSWVFQRRGGFAYSHRDAAKSCFYPVVPMSVGAPENDWYAASAPDQLRFLCPGTDDPSSSPRNLRVRAADAPLEPPQGRGRGARRAFEVGREVGQREQGGVGREEEVGLECLVVEQKGHAPLCLLYTSPSPRDS